MLGAATGAGTGTAGTGGTTAAGSGLSAELGLIALRDAGRDAELADRQVLVRR